METSIYEIQFQGQFVIEMTQKVNCCPIPGCYNKKESKTDIKNFERKINLKAFLNLKQKIKSTKTTIPSQI